MAVIRGRAWLSTQVRIPRIECAATPAHTVPVSQELGTVRPHLGLLRHATHDPERCTGPTARRLSAVVLHALG